MRSLFAILCLAACTCMAVTPSTEWQDVPANATLSQVGTGAGYAKTSDLAGYMTGQAVTNNFVKKAGNEELSGRLSITGANAALTVSGAPTNSATLYPTRIVLMRPGSPYTMYSLTLPEADGTLALQGDTPDRNIAMFIIEVNPWVMERITFTNNANVVYTGFELKASTNNFDKASPLDVKLQFWSQSHSADTGVLDSDKMKIYMPVGNDPSYDMRSYKRIQNTLGMHKGELARMVVLVDTSCLVRHTEDGGKWLSENNEDLVWVYMRDTAGGTETYPGTSTEWWHPIAPVRWFSKMPNWAQ